MKKVSLLATALLFCVISQAQNFSGQAVYESKTSMSEFKMEGDGINDQMRKQMEERIKKMMEKTFVLTFNKEESLYKEEQKLDTPGSGGGMSFGGFAGGSEYKNLTENQYLKDQEFMGKPFLINDSLPTLEWKLEDESKQIGQYVAFKATAVKKPDELTKAFRKRAAEMKKKEKENDDETEEQTETEDEVEDIIITAWYTPQIPIPHGPGAYHGLPGLILELQDNRTTILCSKVILNPKNAEKIKKPSKGTQVTQAEYNKIVQEKMEEMQEMGGRSGRGTFSIRMN